MRTTKAIHLKSLEKKLKELKTKLEGRLRKTEKAFIEAKKIGKELDGLEKS